MIWAVVSALRGWWVWALAAALLSGVGIAWVRGWQLDRAEREAERLRLELEAERSACEVLRFEAAQAGEAAALEINVTRGGSDAPRPGRHEL